MKRNVNANFGLILLWDTPRMAIARMKQPNTQRSSQYREEKYPRQSLTKGNSTDAIAQ